MRERGLRLRPAVVEVLCRLQAALDGLEIRIRLTRGHLEYEYIMLYEKESDEWLDEMESLLEKDYARQVQLQERFEQMLVTPGCYIRG